MAVNIIDKGLSFLNNHENRSGAPKGIILHHAAGGGSVEQIHRIHQNRGYAGIGYHLYIRRDGTVYRGRPEAWLGAHASGYNDRIGVCAEGNFEFETMTAAQKDAVVGVIRYLSDKYGNLPIVGHRDVSTTACPGKNYPLAAIVAAATSAKPAAPTPSKTSGNPLVKAFQKACLADGVSVGEAGADGLWGPDTEQAANNLLVRGSRGERVRALQKRLLDFGYDLGRWEADGIFGEKTEKAVEAFQRDRRLDADRKVGPETWKALLGV